MFGQLAYWPCFLPPGPVLKAFWGKNAQSGAGFRKNNIHLMRFLPLGNKTRAVGIFFKKLFPNQENL